MIDWLLGMLVTKAAVVMACVLCAGGIAIAFAREIVISIVAVCAGMSYADVARTLKESEDR